MAPRLAASHPTASLSQPHGGTMHGAVEENRYKHLLQPIRDLAANWNIDLARDLEEYLDELEHIRVTFDGGVTNLNFAEAALLIQGSACIYSKKVEYLHKLLVQVLDMLVERRHVRVRSQSSIDAAGDDADLVIFDDPEFLPLDDVITQDAHVDLDEPLHRAGRRSVRGNMMLLRTPAALLPADGNADSISFRMQSSSVHYGSGALLLEEKDHARVTSALEKVVGADAAGMPHPLAGAYVSDDDEEEAAALSRDDDDDDANHDGDTYEAGFDAPDLAGGSPVAGAGARVRRRVLGGGGGGAPKRDPWAPLDSHDVTSVSIKPFRKARTTRKPRDLTAAPVSATPAGYTRSTSMHKPCYAEFAYVFAGERKRRTALRKQEARYTWVDDYGDEESGGFDAPDLPGGPCEDDEDDEARDAFALSAAEREREAALHSTGEQQHSALEEAGITHSYEDLCRQYIDQYMSSVQQYAQETSLSRRVSDWQDRLSNVLEREEEHLPFDVHVYGELVLDTFPTKAQANPAKSKPLPIHKLVKAADTYEVCRLFAASLQLANDGNIDIQRDARTGAVSFQLCSTETAVDVNGYKAPSQSAPVAKTLPAVAAHANKEDHRNGHAAPSSYSQPVRSGGGGPSKRVRLASSQPEPRRTRSRARR